MKLKPYSKYKDSGVQWSKEVPKNWKVNKMKFLLETPVTDGPHETPEFIDEGIPFLSVDSIQNGEIIFEDTRFISKEDHIRYKVKCDPKRADVFMGKAASIGKIARVKVDFPFSIWSPLALLRVNKKIKAEFFEYALKSDYSQDQIDNFSTSNTQKNISMDDIPRIQIIFPEDSTEQTQLVSFLDSKTSQLDQTIEKDKQLIELLKEKRTALINHVVTKGLNKTAKMKNSRIDWIGEIPEMWEVRKLNHCFDLIGSGTTPSSSDESYYALDEEKGTPWVNTGDLNDSYLKEPSKKVTKKAIVECSALKLYPENSLVIAMYGATIGKTSIVDFKATYNQACCVLNKSKNLEIRYAHYWFIAKKKDIIALSYGGGQPNISQDVVKKLSITVPPKSIQLQIVQYIDKETSNIDQIIKKIEEKINLMEEYKKSLIHHVVTGKVDVREAVA